jgi:uncharacterized protein (TIGR03067 family)
MQATIALTVFILAAPAPKDAPKKDDIVGEWTVVNQKQDGKAAEYLFADSMSFAADGKWGRVFKGREARNCEKYVVDSTAKPATIDLIFTKDTNVAGAYGIARLDGDTLTLCLNYSSQGRPSKFESPTGSSNMLIVMKRVKKK